MMTLAQEAVANSPSQGLPAWAAPIIAGVFTLIGVAITLIANYYFDKRRDAKARHQREFDELRDWTRDIIAEVNVVTNWATRQQTKTHRASLNEFTVESFEHVERIRSAFEPMDLFVPHQAIESVRNLLTQTLVLVAPVWNTHGYAAQVTKVLQAQLDLINEVRAFGGLEPSTRTIHPMPTSKEAVNLFPGFAFEGMEANLIHHGVPKDVAKEVIDKLITRGQQGEI